MDGNHYLHLTPALDQVHLSGAKLIPQKPCKWESERSVRSFYISLSECFLYREGF